jgi:type VI secretion system protein ImpF
MSRLRADEKLQPSVLDRLIDPEASGTAARPGYTPEQMFRAVRRDLEDLLNTRNTFADLPDNFADLRGSILAYGLPDLTSLNALTAVQQEEIGRAIEQIIALFEPRLKDVRAHLIPTTIKDRTLRFHIDARLCLDPAPEVAFDTILELTSGRYAIQTPGGRS